MTPGRRKVMALALGSVAVVTVAGLVVARVIPGSQRTTLVRGGSPSPTASAGATGTPAPPATINARTPGPPRATPSPAPGSSGISGQVLYGPTCPVERVNSPCPERPGPATVRVHEGATVVATAEAGSDGAFHIIVAPGDYSVDGQGPQGMNYCKPVDVAVRAHQFTSMTLHCDTGIR